MTEDINNYSLDIKMSRSGLPIPIVNDIYLHSAYDPEKEAEALMDRHSKATSSNSKYLIFGLGFGYHINSLKRRVLNNGHNQCEIMVIEPNARVVKAVNKQRLLKDDHSTDIICVANVHDVYCIDRVIQFMLLKPTIIAHPASFNLYNEYYNKLMSYKAPLSAKEISTRVLDIDMKKDLEGFSDINISTLANKIKDLETISSTTMALGAYLDLSSNRSIDE